MRAPLTGTLVVSPVNRLAKIPLTLFVTTHWKGYMDVCMTHVARHFTAQTVGARHSP